MDTPTPSVSNRTDESQHGSLPAQDPASVVADVQAGGIATHIQAGEPVDEHDGKPSPLIKIFQRPAGISPPGNSRPDITLTSTNQVSFQVHRDIICTTSWNDFATLLQGDTQTISIPETSDILNTLLCAIYDIPGNANFDIVKAAVKRMETYGLTPSRLISPTKTLFTELCNHAIQHPMDVFIFAAQYDLEQLAQTTSSRLLSANVQASITDQMAEQMGVIYLRRLFLLHQDRLSTLRNCLTIPPIAHDALETCAGDGAKNAWIFPASALTTSGRHDISPEELAATMVSRTEELKCSVCCGNYMQWVSATAQTWSTVRSTI